MKKYAIIVAGGKGLRMKSDTPKQFLLLVGQPVLMHTLTAFHAFDINIELILVLPKKQINLWKTLVKEHDFTIAHQIIEGGETRFNSVRNGLNCISESGLVAIHDGVRPLISQKTIKTSYEIADKLGNAVASVQLKESLREVKDDTNFAQDRNNYRLMQTPQTFQTSLIKEAFSAAQDNTFTDDAGVLEANGAKIHLIEGDYRNIKITTEEDLIIAEALMNS